jgi:hypothetical protein
MKSVGLALAVVFGAGLLALWSTSVEEILACPASNTCALDDDGATTDENGAFSFTLTAEWHMTSTPFLGGLTLMPETQGTVNILSAEYDPAYFFPTSCEGEMEVQCTGDLDEIHEEGVVNTKFQVGSGYPLACEDLWPTAIPEAS